MNGCVSTSVLLDSRVSGERAADLEHAHRFQGLSFDPVFIVGDHRSGTTVLYQLLASTRAFSVVTAYHVICYDRIVADHLFKQAGAARQRLAALFARLGVGNRVIDGVPVSPDLPEEYGFIIDRSSRPRLRPGTLPAFVELCQKLRFTGGGEPILLKNPWDVLRFAYLKRSFPGARFIFLHRHPRNVMSSQLAAMRSLFTHRNPYVAALSPWYRDVFEKPAVLRFTRMINSSRFGIGARVVGRHVTKVVRYYRENVPDLPRRDYIELRYEDLCAQPDETLQRLMAFLNVHAVRDVKARERVRPRPDHVLPEVARRYRKIRSSLADYCETQRYTLD